MGGYLGGIGSPRDIKDFSPGQLDELAAELRDTIIKGVAQGGGHLASNLGVVELTIALHLVFDTPQDKIVWDVGHQCYTHKLLTGRFDRFDTLRRLDGLAGFPKRQESPHDAFDTGHSSTSISAALGLLEARDIRGEGGKVIAVIGDGSMTAGLAFEGLNHAGQIGKDLIVVLNDNEMSISPNVGALSNYLSRILTGERFQWFRKETRNIIENIPRVGEKMVRLAQRAEESLKGIFLPGLLFEELGFTYVGPIDGHDIETMRVTFENVKKARTPVLLHVITRKGKGYEFSEEDPCVFHGIGPFEVETGSPLSKGVTYSDAFGLALTELAEAEPTLVAITAAMTEGTGLSHFRDRFPGRLYDVGIAEPHAVTFAAGLAAGGARPVVAIYSTFLQRSYDEIIHDVCLQNLPVVFALDRGGIVGDDGPTHNGVFDLSYLRHIPNLTVMAPRGPGELKAMLSMALRLDGPSAIRYPRGKARAEDVPAPFGIGEAEVLRKGSDLALLAIGSMVDAALEAALRLAADGIEAVVVNMRFVKPLDTGLLKNIVNTTHRIITLEENALQGGFGSAVIEWLHSPSCDRTGQHAARLDVRLVGIPDEFVEQGSQVEMRRRYGLDAEGIYRTAVEMMQGQRCGMPGLV